jgi:glycosyltransferase involved in cell wall biosynthesis
VSSALHIAHGVLSLDVGGLERIVLSLVRFGRERGHRVSVVCVERPGKLAAEAEAEGATIVSLDKPPGRLRDYIRRAESVLSDLKPDILHTHQIGATWYLGQAARSLAGPPVLHTEHGNEFARSTSWWKNLKVRLFLRQTARFVEKFCCVSHEIAGGVTRWWTIPKAKVEVIPNGIRTDLKDDLPLPDEVRRELGIPNGATVLGTVGRLAEVKRQDLLIRAVSKLKEAYPDLQLILVGDGPERERLAALARELQITDRVHFLGYQSCPEKYLRIMDAFALTSRSEGFPVSLLEAWVAGVPVVCSAVGGIPDVVSPERDGVLFPPGDKSALDSALSRVLGDRDLRKRLGEAGNRVVRERYSLERMAAEYESRYRSLIADGTGAR